MDKNLVSVVTVCFNAGKTIRRTMESVLEQTYRPMEYIVIDGKSTDETIQIVAQMASFFKAKGILLRSLSERDKGIFDAMNKGVRMATGRWINFMNSGDIFLANDTVERMITADIGDDVKVVYGDFVRKKMYATIPTKAHTPEDIPALMPSCHQAMFVDTGEMKAHPFDLQYRLTADYKFIYDLYMRGGKMLYKPVYVTLYDAVEGVSSTNKLDVYRECARIQGVYNTLKWKLSFFNGAISVFTDRMVQSIVPTSLLVKAKQINRRRLENRHKK